MIHWGALGGQPGRTYSNHQPRCATGRIRAAFVSVAASAERAPSTAVAVCPPRSSANGRRAASTSSSIRPSGRSARPAGRFAAAGDCRPLCLDAERKPPNPIPTRRQPFPSQFLPISSLPNRPGRRPVPYLQEKAASPGRRDLLKTSRTGDPPVNVNRSSRPRYSTTKQREAADPTLPSSGGSPNLLNQLARPPRPVPATCLKQVGRATRPST